MASPAYAATRRYGRRSTLCVVGSVTTNAETGARTVNETTINLRRVVMEATKYGRLQRAKGADQDCGETTFIIWTKDCPTVTKLTQESYIMRDGARYNVITCDVEDDGLVITARVIEGATGKQEITLDVGNNLGLTDSVEQG
jgi:hypothetical protein